MSSNAAGRSTLHGDKAPVHPTHRFPGPFARPDLPVELVLCFSLINRSIFVGPFAQRPLFWSVRKVGPL